MDPGDSVAEEGPIEVVGLGAAGGGPDQGAPAEAQGQAIGDATGGLPLGRPSRSRGLHVLYVFAGVPRDGDMTFWLQRLAGHDKVEVVNVDIVRGKKDDLTKATRREGLLEQVRAGGFDMVLASPPCTTLAG